MKKEIVTLTKEEFNAKKIELAKIRTSFADALTKAKQTRVLKKSIAQHFTLLNK